MRRTSALAAAAIVVTVALGGLVAPPSAIAAPETSDTVAAAKAKPRLTVSKERRTTTSRPFKLTTTYRMPVLTGSAAKQRKLVTRYARDLIAAEKKMVAQWRSRCRGTDPASINAYSVKATIHRARYASVAMLFASDAGCGGVGNTSARSFTLDLRTGKKVSLKTFASPSAGVTRLAIYSRLARAYDGCMITSLDSTPVPDAWAVSSKGLRVWFDKYAVGVGACGTMSVLVPWTDVASSAQVTGKRYTRTYVKDLKKSAYGWYGEVVQLTVQGRRIAVYYGILDSESYCQIGVRTGKKASLFDTASASRTVTKLHGTTAKPRITLGQGWREATSTQRVTVRELGFPTDAIATCAVTKSSQG